MPAYYSEYDKNAAAWLRELIKRGLIADGEVDERDLWDVAPIDLTGFTQVHLCAGIGVWSYALRQAGWPDDRPVWTGSFPCQPYSAAGKRKGFADERHLWPAGYHLVEFWRPRILFGEQVASKDAEPWLDLVQADMEALGYAFGACAFPAASIGAPHIRDRSYWVANLSGDGRREECSYSRRRATGDHAERNPAGLGAERSDSRLADDDDDARLEGRRQPGRERAVERPAGSSGVVGGLANAEDSGTTNVIGQSQPSDESRTSEFERVGAGAGSGTDRRNRAARNSAMRTVGGETAGNYGELVGSNPIDGFWRGADWLFCRDQKFRPVRPGSFPLVDGTPGRVGLLRGYGNAIVAPAAQAWIESYLEATGERAFTA